MPIFSVSSCQKFGGAKRRKRIFELLQQKTEYFYDARDSVREEHVKELMLGTAQTRECQKWLNDEREIEGRLNDILRINKENSGGVLYSCMKVPHEDLMKALDEVTYHLENSPLGNTSIACTPHRITNNLASLSTGSNPSQLVDHEKNTETKSETNLMVHTQRKGAALTKEMLHGKSVQSLEEGTSVLAREMGLRIIKPETELLKSAQTSVAISPDRGTKALTRPRIGSKTHGQVDMTMIMKQSPKADTKAEFTAEEHSQWKKDRLKIREGKLEASQDAHSSVLEDVKIQDSKH